jgi:hypothetical protein
MKKQKHLAARLLLAGLAVAILIFGGLRIYNRIAGRQAVQATTAALTADAFYSDPASGYSRLTAEEQQVYAAIKNGAEAFNAHVDLSDQAVDADSLNRIWAAFGQDNPQYFWFDGFTYQYNGTTGKVESMDMTFFYDKKERDSRQDAIDTTVQDFENSLTPGMDDYALAKAAHDYVITHTEYDVDSDDNQNICSVFNGGRSVCAGYARAYQYLLQRSGIFCIVVNGTAVGRGTHAWNLVKLDGDYYYVDPTWDDPSFSGDSGLGADHVEYGYFAITTDELQRDHVINDPLGTPALCTATADNYFVREDCYFDDTAAFIQRAEAAAGRGDKTYSAKFTTGDLTDSAVKALGKSTLTSSGSIRYYRNDAMNVLTLLLNND